MTTKTHEIKLDGYGAHTTLAEDRPIMLLGTAESYGIETLHVVSGKSWEGLTITATFNTPDGTSTDMLMDADGSITVPSEATAKSGSGKIVFTGVSNGIQRISCDLEYFVVAHSAINGAQSGGTAPSWFEQAVNRFMPLGGTTGQVLTKKTDADFEAEWQDSQGGAGLEPLVGTTQTITPSQVIAAIKEGRDIALQYTDSYYGVFVFSAFNANEKLGIVVSNSILPQMNGLTGTLLGFVDDAGWVFKATNTATKDDVGTAVNEALTAAKASGEFDGADGKSAYSYAQDGGYTGTEAEFAAKLAAEKLPNPYPLTFTGAVSETYDGSSAKTIEIPSGGGGSSALAGLAIADNYDIELISHVIIDQNNIPTAGITVTQKDDGSPFAYDGLLIWTDAKSSASYTTFNFNGYIGYPIEMTHGNKNLLSMYITDGTTMSIIIDRIRNIIKQSHADTGNLFYPDAIFQRVPEKFTSFKIGADGIGSVTFYKAWGLTRK